MPEPFVNYILEGSVSISTCKFEVTADDNTDSPKVALITVVKLLEDSSEY